MCSIEKNEQDSCALERSSFTRLVPVGLVRSIFFAGYELGNIKNRIFFEVKSNKDDPARYYLHIVFKERHVLSEKFDDKSSISLSSASVVISLLVYFICQGDIEKSPGFDSRSSIFFAAFNYFIAAFCPAILTVENESE